MVENARCLQEAHRLQLRSFSWRSPYNEAELVSLWHLGSSWISAASSRDGVRLIDYSSEITAVSITRSTASKICRLLLRELRMAQINTFPSVSSHTTIFIVHYSSKCTCGNLIRLNMLILTLRLRVVE